MSLEQCALACASVVYCAASDDFSDDGEVPGHLYPFDKLGRHALSVEAVELVSLRSRAGASRSVLDVSRSVLGEAEVVPGQE